MVEEAAVVIRPGGVAEGARLKQIAIASKAHWGYELARVEEWADRGDFTPETLRKLALFVAESGGEAIGWASVEPRGETAWLADLWVDPEWIGKGVGSRLFRHAAEHARANGASALEWEAEPNALGFYEKLGGRRVRESAPSVWGRAIPVMSLELR